VRYKIEQDNQAHGALIVAQETRPAAAADVYSVVATKAK